MTSFRCLFGAVIASIVIACSLHAADAPATAPIQWAARDQSGKDIKVPAADRPSVVAFLRANQPQSADAVAQIRAVAERQPNVQIIVALSGPNHADAVATFVQKQKVQWPVVLDPDYAASGRMNVHVWPTTVVVASDGSQVAHLAGLPQSYESDLQAYLDFASGKIDKAALDRQLANRQTIVDTPQQAAGRHARVAAALFERGQFDQARTEIDAGLKLVPGDPALRVALVKVMLMQNEAEPALAAVDQLNGAVPPWQFNLLRAESLIALNRWDEARSAVAEAIKLNPNPAAAHYLSGQIFAHEKKWEQASEAFRKAYESKSEIRNSKSE